MTRLDAERMGDGSHHGVIGLAVDRLRMNCHDKYGRVAVAAADGRSRGTGLHSDREPHRCSIAIH